MRYQNKHGNSTITVDSDAVAKRFFHGDSFYVCPTTEEERARFIGFLEEEGFSYSDDSRRSKNEAFMSPFPLSVSMDDKKYSFLGNNTSAAAACSRHIVASEKEFYVLYSYRKLRDQ